MYIHDTYFIVAHIHYVLFGGSLFAIFAAVTYWFPKMFGRLMNETAGKVHFWITFVGFNCTFFPMHILGMGGHMRRIYNPLQYDFLKPMQGMNEFMTISALVLGAACIAVLMSTARPSPATSTTCRSRSASSMRPPRPTSARDGR